MNSKDILTYLFFVVLAALIWYANAINSTRSVHLRVPIVYIGADASVVLSDSIPDVIDIEVIDKGSQLASYRGKNRLVLHKDISSRTQQPEGLLSIPSEELRRDLMAILHGSTALQKTKPESIEGGYYRQQSKDVPVVWAGACEAAAQYHISDAPVLTPSTIMVYGKKQQLDTLQSIVLPYTQVTDIRDTMVVTIPVTLPEGLRSECTAVQATFVAEQFTEKRFMVPIEVQGCPEGMVVHLFPKEVEVILSVAVRHFAQITESDIHVVCPMPTSDEHQLTPQVTYTQAGIFSARIFPKHIDFLVEYEDNTNGGSADAVSTH